LRSFEVNKKIWGLFKINYRVKGGQLEILKVIRGQLQNLKAI
jgi:hypothetical protein